MRGAGVAATFAGRRSLVVCMSLVTVGRGSTIRELVGVAVLIGSMALLGFGVWELRGRDYLGALFSLVAGIALARLAFELVSERARS